MTNGISTGLPRRARRRPTGVPVALGAAGAGTVLLGTLLTTFGLSFDIQWHSDVGPDTFFTLSHLMLYAGSALAGLASLVVVLAATARQRQGRPLPSSIGGAPVRVFGSLFRAPLGYLVTGAGAASFLLFGLLDLGWHAVYGFDAVLNSPPHIGLFLSITLSMVGSLIVGAAARNSWWGKASLVISITVLMTFAPITTMALDGLSLPLEPLVAGSSLLAAAVLVLAGTVLRRPGSVIVVAVAFGVLQAALWPFSVWAAHSYADSIGLPLRDGLTGEPPQLPSTMPLFLIVGALAIELSLHTVRRRRLSATVALAWGGAATGLVVGVTLPFQQVLLDPTEYVPAIAYLVCGISGAVLGAAGGFLGLRIGTMLSSGPTPATRLDRVASARTAVAS